MKVIIHKLDVIESAANDGPARNSGDIERCESLFQTYLGVTVSNTNAFHLGKKSDKPCLLKITLSDVQEKMAILKNKSKLMSSKNPQHICDVFVTSNFTLLEQKENKELCEQLVDMNRTENMYVIQNGKIVQR